MRRSVVIAAAVLASLPIASAQGAMADADVKLANVKLLSCSQTGHSAVFRGKMTRVAGADSMALRYTLLSKLPTAKEEARVRVPGLGRWHHSKPGVGTFAFKQEVLNLAAGGSYRMRAEFRWSDATGAVLKTTKRRSPVCQQVERLPNLRVEITGGQPTKAKGIWRYGLRVTNNGLGTASAFGVRLSVDGAVVDVETVAQLDPGVVGRVVVRGPACERWADGEVDPDGTVVESNEADNAHHAACADIIRD